MPHFNSDVLNYTLYEAAHAVQVVAIPNNANATLTINGKLVVIGSGSTTVPVASGQNNSIVIAVRAANGVTARAYTVQVSPRQVISVKKRAQHV